MSQRTLHALTLAILCTFVLGRAHAQSPSVTVGSCEGVDQSELQRLLTIELHTLGAEAHTFGEVQVTCREATVEVFVRGQNSPPLHAELELQGHERGSLTRLLALRISEFLATPVSAAAPLPPKPTTPPALPAPPAERPHALRPSSAHHALLLLLHTRRIGNPSTWLSGASLGYAQPLFFNLTLCSEASMSAGRANAQVADVGFSELGLALSLLFNMHAEYVSADVGAGLRTAWVFLNAEGVDSAHQGRSLSAPWLGPFAAGHMRFHGTGAWLAMVGVEGGLVTVPVKGLLDRERSVLAIEGPWLGLNMGAGYRW